MYKDKMSLMGGQFQGLNMNPIPMEFSQQMTTTKWLMSLLAKIDEVIGFTNGWYDEIIKDLENDGVLYDKLSAQFLTTFGNDIANLTNDMTSLTNTLNELLYIKPSAVMTLSCDVNNLLGTTLNGVIVSANITGSLPLTKTEFYVNGVLYSTINGDNKQPYITLNGITADSTIYIKMFDSKNSIHGDIVNIKFFQPAFIGVVDSTISTPNESAVKSLLTWNVYKRNISNTFICTNNKVVYAIPQSWGALSSIRDYSKVNLGDSFIRQSLNITINGQVVPYYVYISINAVTLDNFNIDFNLSEV